MQRAILLGNVLWLGITTRLRPEDGDYHIYAKQALNFRKNIHEFIKGAEFLDNKYIDSISTNCDATSWRMKNGNILIIAGNHNLHENSSVNIRQIGFNHAKLYDINWNHVDFSLIQDCLNVPLVGRLYALILEV